MIALVFNIITSQTHLSPPNSVHHISAIASNLLSIMTPFPGGLQNKNIIQSQKPTWNTDKEKLIQKG